MSPMLPSIGTRVGAGWNELLQRTPVDGGTLGEVLGDQVRFWVARSGATSVRDVRPDSRAARELWAHPETQRFAQGVLDIANGISNNSGTGTPLRGFTLSTSTEGYVANRAVHHFGPDSAASADALEGALRAARNHVTGTAAVRKGTWLHLGPDRSAGIVHMLENPGTTLQDLSPKLRTQLGRGVKSLLHELNHVNSPRPADARKWDWLSEGTAETLARWPGRVPEAGRQLGFEVPKGVGRSFDRRGGPYREEVQAVRGLLELAGINHRRASAFDAAEQLLNGPTEPFVPRALADRIAARHAHNPDDRAELARMIEQRIRTISPDGSNADPSVVTRLAAELRQARQAR